MLSGIGALLGTGTSLISGAFSGIGANKRQKRAIAAQKEENERARQYNKETASWYSDDVQHKATILKS